ncbi:MAG: trypsin-like peptidase domain-containing protein [Candidatus Sungbacteria bacterium]|nr:trypsin-like peptidase domain-containing protein [Candidatus Sungbacteria bacterium]
MARRRGMLKLATRFCLLFFAGALLGCASSEVIPKNFPDPLKKIDPKSIARMYHNNAEGNGWFFSYDGCLVTVAHYSGVSVGSKFSVWNGSLYEGKVLFVDTHWDIAVLKVKGEFPVLPLPEEDIIPKMGETVYVITRNGNRKLEYLMGAVMLVNSSLIISLPDGGIAYFPGAFAFWADSAAVPGWSGSRAEGGGVANVAGYVVASDLEHKTYYHILSRKTLESLFSGVWNACRK